MTVLDTRKSALSYYGFSNEEVDKYLNSTRNALTVQQSNERQNESDENSVYGPIKEYWNNVIDSVKTVGELTQTGFKKMGSDLQEVSEDVKESAVELKEGAVGKDFEFEEYWKRGLGKSTLSLALEYHTNNGLLGADMQTSLQPEPEDTGHIERAIETVSTLIGDIPVGALSAGATAMATGGNIIASGASAGFVTEGMRQTYIEALQRGQVENFSEWWNIFIEKGLGEAVKAGIVTGAGVGAPGIVDKLGGRSALLKFGTQYGVFSSLGPILEGRLPTKNELINVGLVMAGLGGTAMGVKKGTDMIINRVGSSNKTTAQVLEEVSKSPDMLEDALSSNMTGFRKPVADGDKLEVAFEGGKVPEFLKEPIKKPDVEKQKLEKSLEELNEPLISDDKAIESIASTISTSKKTSSILANLVDSKNKSVTQFLDKLHPAFVAEQAIKKSGGNLNEAITAYQQFRIQPGQVGKSVSFLSTGTFKFDAPTKNTGKSLTEVFKNYTPKMMKEWDVYAKSKRAIERNDKGLETGVDIAAAKQAVKALDKKHGKAFKEYLVFQDSVLDYMVDSGMTSKDTAMALREASKDYVPFARDIEVDASGPFSSNIMNPYKAFKGSEKATFSPSETVFMNTLSQITAAERNFANVKFIELIESNPTVFPNIKKSVARAKATKLTREELEKVVDNPKSLKDETVDGFSVFRRDGHQLSDSEIVVFRKGKREVWEVGEDLAKIFKDASREEAGFLIKIAEPFSKTLRVGATLAPDFVVRNLSRDTISAAILSDNSFIPLYHSLSGFKSLIFKGDKMYENFVKSGAMQSMFISMDRNYFAQNMKQFMQADKMRNVITNPLEWLRVSAELFETSSRLGEFKLSYNKLKRNKNLTDKEILEGSGFAARDVTLDFGRIGTKVANWNRINAFLNATIQGHVKLYESFKRNPVRTTAKISAYITAPSVLLWLQNHDDERYKDLPRWQKDLFWIYITGDGTLADGDYTVWRIPKPFGPGIVFGTGAERMLDHFVDEDPIAMKKFVNEQIGGFSTLTGLLPDVVRPALEIYTNKSFFTDKPIVPRYLEKVLPEYRYSEYTSETGKIVGKWLSETTNGTLGSPASFDHIMSSWTGTLGRYGLEFSDYLLNKFDVVDTPEKPLDTLSDVPFIKAFVVRNPTGGSEQVERFYDYYNQVSAKLNTIQKLLAENNPEEAQRVHGKINFKLLPLVEMQKAISSQSKYIKAIYNSDMTPEEKRQAIDEIYRAMIVVAKQGVSIAENTKE
tara:strand:+ start:1492 stop:5262 length:3771 start_codon:yes stop_codon:yes gene_type:complete